jgi:hypothetical protein
MCRRLEVTAAALYDGRALTLGVHQLQFPDSRFTRWLEFYAGRKTLRPEEGPGVCRIAIVEWPCVIVDITHPSKLTPRRREGWLWWIDGETGLPFASQQWRWDYEFGLEWARSYGGARPHPGRW